jgi:signal recognition particle subunit SRP54
MGDIVSLVEKAEQNISEDEAKKLEEKIRKNNFDFNDFLKQLQMLKKMGSIKDLLGMIPGLGGQLKGLNVDDGQLSSIESIIQSMTKRERMIPELVENEIKRKKRIASGCGQSVQHVTMLLKQFTQMKKMMSGLGKMKGMFGGGGAEMDSIGGMMSGQQFSEKDLQMAKNVAKGRPMPDKDAIKKKRKAEKQAKKANRKKKK